MKSALLFARHGHSLTTPRMNSSRAMLRNVYGHHALPNAVFENSH